MKQRFNLVCPACGKDEFECNNSIAECDCGFVGYVKDLEIKEVDDD